MKFICVGRNYRNPDSENKNEDIQSPLSGPIFFMKPETAITRCNRPFFIPEFSQDIYYETELLVKINRLGKHIQEKHAHLYYEEIGLGIDFTAHDVLQGCIERGEPWEIAKAFDGSAVVGDFVPINQFDDLQNLNFHLTINDQLVQQGNTGDMIHTIDQIIAYVSKSVMLKMGDIIFTGTPAGVGPVHIDDHLQGYLEGQKMFDFNVK